MLPKERVLAAFEHRETDKVPIYQAGFSSRVASAILGREAYVGGGIQRYREAVALWNGEQAHKEFLEKSRRDAFDLIRVLDLDYVRPSYWRLPQKPTRRIDEFTFFYGDESKSWKVMRFDPETELYQVIDYGPKVKPTIENLEKQVAAQEKAVENYEPKRENFTDALLALEEFGAERAVPGSGVGIGIPHDEVWLEAIALRPDIVARHLDCQAERAVRNIKLQAELGFRFLQGGGDFASNKGPFYSPRAFHELMLPRLKRISDTCHKYGCFHMFASDGNLWAVADDLFGESGVDCFYEIDRLAGMELSKLRQRFPHLTLMGNISSTTLHIGTRDDVIAETLSCLEDAKKWGSIIVGCSNQIVAQTPIENFWAMMETLRENR